MPKYNGDYYVGIDMGTGDVGWAVTDECYRKLRAKGHDLWGTLLFKEAETAAHTRSYRTGRRCYDRKIHNCTMLKELFSDEINKVDPGFFHRLEESMYWIDDRTGENTNQKYAIFSADSTEEGNFTDKEYYEKYPTIFHLRRDLVNSAEPHDVRLVYLALLNMFKHRGHFLNESLGTEKGSGFVAAWDEFLDSYSILMEEKNDTDVSPDENPFKIADRDKLKDVLLKKGMSKSQIRDEAACLLGISKKDKCDYSVLSLICGLTGNLEYIFGEEPFESTDEKGKKSLNFRKGSFDENFAVIEGCLNENDASLILVLKEIHDTLLLDQILGEYTYLCHARVAMHEEHKSDLMLLKKTIKRLAPKKYSELFREMKDGNYSAYVGSTNSDKAGGKIRRYIKNHDSKKKHNKEPDELYKNIKSILEPFKGDPDVDAILTRIENEVFLRKQLTSSNGIIPNQVYVMEMKAILENAENYIPFLKEKDSNGLTVSERILMLFRFRLPYFVGPLGGINNKDGNKWAVRVSGEPINPWNIDKVIDMGETQKNFIENLIRHCTYLADEKVIPKNSLLYEKFMVLNELNGINIAGNPIDVELKQDIYNELFMKGKQITRKKLAEYLVKKGKLEKGAENLIGGIDDRFNSYLSSVGKFNGVFKKPYLDHQHIEMIEDIILLGTIYKDSKKTLREQIEKLYGKDSDATLKLTDSQIDKISGFKFKDWGRFSRAFLELEGCSRDDGVVRTIIDALWETNDNLMQLLSQDKYTYTDSLNSRITRGSKSFSEWDIEDLDDMYLSAPVKRMVWQTLKILSEIVEIMGYAPKRVFVEMIRENRVKGEKPKSRKEKLIARYKDSDLKDKKKWIAELNNLTEGDLKSKKLYLYYCQMGMDMYTVKPIDKEQLTNDNIYDIDHIYPRHFVKDDSLENNLVLVDKRVNSKKDDDYPLAHIIRTKCSGLWENLLKNNLISKEKYRRLVRTEKFTLDERVDFVQRQLVETGQGTKAITQILKEALPESSDIVFSKAGVVSQFRKDFDIPKCRSVNEFHHAQDAYLNIVVGNVYFTKFTKSPRNFIKKSMADPKDARYKYHLGKMFEYTVRRGSETSWIHEENGQHNTIDLVKDQVSKTTPLITRRSFIYTGSITNKDTVYGKQKAEKKYLPVKTSDPRLSDVTKYGGRQGVSTAAYTLISYKEGGKEIRSIEPIPVLLFKKDELDIDADVLLKYIENKISSDSRKPCSDFRILHKVIKFYSLLKVDGYYYYIGGCNGNNYYLYNAVPLKLPSNVVFYVKKMDKAIKTEDFSEVDENEKVIITAEKNMELYDILVNKLNSGIYLNRRSNLAATLSSKRDVFKSLTIPDQCKVLQNLIASWGANTQGVDLTLIGKAKTAGRMLLPKNIGNLKECELINLSATGLYEHTVDLLKL